jgi:hypothetical protein
VRQAFVVLADLAGSHSVLPAIPKQVRRSSRAARVVVSTRPASPVADALRVAGLHCAAVDPTAAPTWFVPPPESNT